MKKLFKLYHRARLSYKDTFKKELRAILSDKAVLGVFISTGFIVMVLYAYIYSKEVVREIPVAVVDEDNSAMSRQYIQMLDATEQVQVMPGFYSMPQAEDAFFKREVKGVLYIPDSFSEDVRKGRQADVAVHADASYMLYYRQVLTAVTYVNAYYSAGIDLKKLMAAGYSEEQARAINSPVAYNVVTLYNPASGYGTYIIPMVTALVVQVVLLMAIGILGGSRRESSQHHFLFPRALKRGGTIPILFGKASVYAILYALLLVLQLGLVFTFFEIPVRAGLGDLFLFMLPYFLSVVFLGIFLTGLFRYREDAIMGLIFTTLPMLMLSGLSYPIEGFPPFFQKLSWVFPSTWGVRGFVKLTQMGVPLQDVAGEWQALWWQALVYFILASMVLKGLVRSAWYKS